MFQQRPASDTASGVTQISVADLRDRLAAHAPMQLIDVRSEDEFQHDGHVADAKLIPLPALAQRLGEIGWDTPVVVICRWGTAARSRPTCWSRPATPM